MPRGSQVKGHAGGERRARIGDGGEDDREARNSGRAGGGPPHGHAQPLRPAPGRPSTANATASIIGLSARPASPCIEHEQRERRLRRGRDAGGGRALQGARDDQGRAVAGSECHQERR